MITQWKELDDMKRILVLLIIGFVAVIITGCTTGTDQEGVKVEPGEHIETKPEIFTLDAISKIDFVFYNDEIAIDDFDGRNIYISTWHDSKSAVIDLEGNLVVPWQEGNLDIDYAKDDVFCVSYYDNIQNEELNGANDVAAETSYNFYVKNHGFMYDEPLADLFYTPEFIDGYAMLHGHDGEKEFAIFIDSEGNVVREIYPSDDKYAHLEFHGRYIYYRDGFGEDGDYKYINEDIITGEILNDNPFVIDDRYKEFFSDEALIYKNNTDKAIVTEGENRGLYDLTNGEKIQDLEYDMMHIEYHLKDTYYVKLVQDDNHNYVFEVYDFEGKKLAVFYENFNVHTANDSILYEYGGEAFYWKIG